jgi:hypothetical protein
MNQKSALGAGHVGQQALGSGHACELPLFDAREYGVPIRHISDAALVMPEEGMQQLLGKRRGRSLEALVGKCQGHRLHWILDATGIWPMQCGWSMYSC